MSGSLNDNFYIPISGGGDETGCSAKGAFCFFGLRPTCVAEQCCRQLPSGLVSLFFSVWPALQRVQPWNRWWEKRASLCALAQIVLHPRSSSSWNWQALRILVLGSQAARLPCGALAIWHSPLEEKQRCTKQSQGHSVYAHILFSVAFV